MSASPDPRPASGTTVATRPRAARWAGRAALALALWTAVGLVSATQIYLQWPEGGWRNVLQIAMPRWYICGLLTPLVFAVDHRWLARLPLARRIAAHVLLGLVFILVALPMDYAIQRAFGTRFLPTPLSRYLLEQSFGGAMTYAFVAGASLASSFAAQARRREQEAARLALHSAHLEASLAEARLRALQSQLNPHFLFNAFNTISALTETDPRTARRMMARLGALLRSSLDHAARQEVTLAEELRFLDDYLAIERLRFEGRLTVDVNAEEGVRDALVPSFVLQPLVENAIRHGTGALLRTGHVRLTARRDVELRDRLLLAVEDDGVGLPEGWRLEDHAGVGLSNIARRLAELYGPAHGFAVTARAEGGVRVEIALPLRRGLPEPATPALAPARAGGLAAAR